MLKSHNLFWSLAEIRYFKNVISEVALDIFSQFNITGNTIFADLDLALVFD